MAYREFFDHSGHVWRVWEVRPGQSAEARVVSAHLSEGWLAFESPTEKRRLAPIPPDWSDDMPEDRLRDLKDQAVFVRERGESGVFPRFMSPSDAS